MAEKVLTRSLPMLMTPDETADYLSLDVNTLKLWRHERKEIDFVKVGGAVRYKVADVLSYIEHNTVRAIR